MATTTAAARRVLEGYRPQRGMGAARPLPLRIGTGSCRISIGGDPHAAGRCAAGADRLGELR